MKNILERVLSISNYSIKVRDYHFYSIVSGSNFGKVENKNKTTFPFTKL